MGRGTNCWKSELPCQKRDVSSPYLSCFQACDTVSPTAATARRSGFWQRKPAGSLLEVAPGVGGISSEGSLILDQPERGLMPCASYSNSCPCLATRGSVYRAPEHREGSEGPGRKPRSTGCPAGPAAGAQGGRPAGCDQFRHLTAPGAGRCSQARCRGREEAYWRGAQPPPS